MVELLYWSHRKIVPSYYNSAIIASWDVCYGDYMTYIYDLWYRSSYEDCYI